MQEFYQNHGIDHHNGYTFDAEILRQIFTYRFLQKYLPKLLWVATFRFSWDSSVEITDNNTKILFLQSLVLKY